MWQRLWQHHPDCEFWWDQYPFDCCCGLTAPRPEWSKLEKWTAAQFQEWRESITRQMQTATSPPSLPDTPSRLS